MGKVSNLKKSAKGEGLADRDTSNIGSNIIGQAIGRIEKDVKLMQNSRKNLGADKDSRAALKEFEKAFKNLKKMFK